MRRGMFIQKGLQNANRKIKKCEMKNIIFSTSLVPY